MQIRMKGHAARILYSGGGGYYRAARVSVIVHLRLLRLVSWIEEKGWNEDRDIIRSRYKTHATHFVPLTH